MEIVSALLVASALTNLSFDISDIPEIRFESVTTEQAISEASKPKRFETDIDATYFMYSAWAYSYLILNMIIRANSPADARELADKFVSEINKCIPEGSPFVITQPSETDACSLLELNQFLIDRPNNGPIFMISRMSNFSSLPES